MIPPPPPGATGRCRKPRASGDDPDVAYWMRKLKEVNPARAGMIRRTGSSSTGPTSKPRASGDDPPLDVGRISSNQ